MIEFVVREWMPRDRILLVTKEELEALDAAIARFARLLIR